MKQQKGTCYYTNRHACFLLQYHLVLITRYRHPVLVSPIKERLVELIHYLLEDKAGCLILAVNTDEDHVHILFEAPPQIQLSAIINNLKTVTSRILRKEFAEQLKPFYWKPYFWSMSYFVATVSETSTAAVKTYIDNQGG